MQIVKRVALVLAGLIGAALLLAVLGTFVPYPFMTTLPDGAPPTHRILVVGNTIHTDIAIPLEPQSLSVFAALAGTGPPIDHPAAHWLLFGWGGRSFYLETPTLADIKPGPTFRAFTIDRSVMHVDVLASLPEPDPAVMPIVLSDAAYTNLLASIAASFRYDNGQVEPIAGFAYGGADKFYEAEGNFNALVGCNVWTARMLRSAGIRTGIWDPLPLALTTSLSLFNRHAADGTLE